MNSNDANYDMYAEVHVPGYCAVPAAFMEGCMLPEAVNYDPAAKQPGECHFQTVGCTDSTAVNFNSRATISDGTCVQSRPGCTIHSESYFGVASDTPGYRSGFYGSAATGSGGVAYGKVNETVYGQTSVVNYDSSANVNQGCIVAIEGCMDSSARNYDPHATVNSHSWCVPRVVGCMVPDEANAASSYSNPQNVSVYPHLIPHKPDEPTTSFLPSVTQHDPSLCGAARYGCTVPGNLNFDPLATVNTTCYQVRYGCLNPSAINFGCPSTDSHTNCTLPEAERVTVHYSFLCLWSIALSPPSPPPPPTPPVSAVEEVLAEVQFSTDIADTTANVLAKELSMKQAFVTWTNAGKTSDQVAFRATAVQQTTRRLQAAGASVSPASITNVFMSVTLDSPTAAAAAVNELRASVGDTATSLQSAFASNGVLVSVLTAPTVTINTTYVERTTTSSSSSTDDGVLIGAIVGGVCALLILVAITFAFYYRRKSSKVFVG
jgi:hypothetical protein